APGGRAARAGIGRPGWQDGALFVAGEIGVVDDIARVVEGGCRVKQCVEVQVEIVVRAEIGVAHVVLRWSPFRGGRKIELEQREGVSRGSPKIFSPDGSRGSACFSVLPAR